MEFNLLQEDGLRLRFVVGSIEGPWSPTFVAWANQGKGDVYLSARSMAGDLKVSLHESGECALALTREHLKKQNLPVQQRARETWTPVGMGAPGFSRALSIVIPPTELRTFAPPPKKAPVVFIPPAPEGMVTEISAIFSEAGTQVDHWPGATTGGTSFLAAYSLMPKRSLWFVSRNVDLPDKWRDEIERYRTALRPVASAQSDAVLFARGDDGLATLFALSIEGTASGSGAV